MVLLTDLPPEILHSVLAQVDPPDLARVPRVCRALHGAVAGNAPLFKHVYLRHLDPPPPGRHVDWERAVRDLVRLQQVVCRRGAGVEEKKDELAFVYATVTSLIENASSTPQPHEEEEVERGARSSRSRNAALLGALFRDDETNQAAFLCRSFLYQRARGELQVLEPLPLQRHEPVVPPRPVPAHQMSAHLHCLYGVPRLWARPEVRRHSRSSHSHHHLRSSSSSSNSSNGTNTRMGPFAGSRVYDLRQYTRANHWGPFLADGSGRVDWERCEAVMLVIGANLRRLGLASLPLFRPVWGTPFPGVWPGSYRPLERLARPTTTAAKRDGVEEDEGKAEKEGKETDDEPSSSDTFLSPDQDPYGVSGTWLRVVCFLDYHDFIEYNFGAAEPLPMGVPRPVIDVAAEATRVLVMKLRATKTEPPGPGDGQALPVVHYRGVAHALDDARWAENASSAVRGTVRLTPEGAVRWTSLSVYSDGEERWRSEGVQVGGLRSARGVLGNWFDKDYDPHGPVGPTAFWKVSDRQCEDNDEELAAADDFVPFIESILAIHDEAGQYDPHGHLEEEEDEEDEEEDWAGMVMGNRGILFANWTEGFED